MIKETIIKLIKRQNVTDAEINTLLAEYVNKKKGAYPTTEQLAEIKTLVYNRLFGLEPVIEHYTKEFNLQVETLVDLKTNNILKIEVYG